MTDMTTTVGQLKETVAEFIKERSWEPYHSPKNLAGSICIEAAELLEIFQWEEVGSEASRSNKHLKARIAGEAADIMIYLISLANAIDMDLSDAIRAKLEKNRKKYPI